MKKVSAIVLTTIMAIVAVISIGATTTVGTSFDWTTPDACASCKYGNGALLMPPVVDDWKQSEHAYSYDEGHGATTYCARCKSPFEYVIGSHYPGNPVPESEWQGVTCRVCHPPHDTGIEGIGFFDAAVGEYVDVPEPPDVTLCVNCHTGSHHLTVFSPGYGRIMAKKGVTCYDCHMPEVPTEGFRDHYSHTLHTENSVMDPYYSCGMARGECHDNKDSDWAAKQIAKGKIHTVGYDADCNQPWQDCGK